jgi:hypothetical protein
MFVIESLFVTVLRKTTVGVGDDVSRIVGYTCLATAPYSRARVLPSSTRIFLHSRYFSVTKQMVPE